MKLSLFIRRLHLYLGIALLPWFLMYAIGAFVLNHRPLFETPGKPDQSEWTLRFEKDYHRPVPDDADIRAVSEAILDDLDLAGRSFYAHYSPRDARLTVHTYTFLSTTAVEYDTRKGSVQVRDQAFRWNRFFSNMHTRGGFTQKPWLTKVWAAIVDLVGLALLAWVFTGIYIWWTGRHRRLAGGVLLAAGIACYVLLVAAL